MKKIKILNKNCPQSKLITATLYTNFWGKLKGLMFKKEFTDKDSIVFDQNNDSRLDSAIHMLFMNFDITVIWVNSNMKVVDIRKAKKWALAYIPKFPARYVIETTEELFSDYHIGDQLEIIYE